MTTIRDTTPALDIDPAASEVTMPASLLRKMLHQALGLLDQRPRLTITVTVAGRPVAILRQSPRTVINDPTAAVFDKSEEKSSGKCVEKSPPEPAPTHNAIQLTTRKR